MLVWLNGSPTTPPAFLEVRSNKYFIVVSVAAAVFTDLFLYGIVVPVLPFALTTRAGVAPDSVQTWVSTLLAVYGAALLVASPLCGWAADRSTSRKMPLVLGLLALAGATVMLTVGSSIAVLVVGRLLQGLSAAVVWVVGLALLVDTVGSSEIGEAMGYVGLSMSIAVMVAPLLGGVVFDKGGYYAVFYMAFALLGVDIVLRLALIEKKVALQWKREDIEETGVDHEQGMELRATTEDGKPGSSAGQEASSQDPKRNTLESGAIAEEAGKEAGAEQTTPPDGTIPSQLSTGPWTTRLPPVILLLSSRRLLAALWACLIQGSLLTSFDSTLPIFVRNTFHWNSIGAGLIFLPLIVPSFAGPFIGWVSDRYGARWLATAGFIAACPILILMRLVSYDSLRQKVLLCALLALVGVTLNLVLTPMMAEITYAVEATAAKRPEGFLGKKGAYAQAYGLFNMAFAGGCLIGPLVGGLVTERAGWGATTLTLGLLSAVTAVPTLIWTSGSLFRRKRRRLEREAREGDQGE